MELTHGTLLGGRVRYDQPADGYRTALEPVLLAASIPARPGARVIEAGCGAGAGLLCLASRVRDIEAVGLERDGALAALAAGNFAANGFARLRAEAADIATWHADAPFDHAFANPPWYSPSGTTSPDAARRAAKQAHIGLLQLWVVSLARNLRPRGTLSVILPAAALTEALTALTAARCGDSTVIPLWPRADKRAKLLIIRGTFLSKGAARLLPGLVLHEGERFSAGAERVLREGGAL